MLDLAKSSALLRIKKNPYCIARNTTSYELLKTLIKHPNADVRLATIANDLMDISLLSELSNDEDHYVRYSVAINLLTSKKDLVRLSHDHNALVRKGVCENITYYTKAKDKFQAHWISAVVYLFFTQWIKKDRVENVRLSWCYGADLDLNEDKLLIWINLLTLEEGRIKLSPPELCK